MSNIVTGTVKEINRVALASAKKYLFNTNRIGELKSDITDSVFPYTENKLGDRYSATEYKISETKATIDALWTGYENQISLPALQKKVGSKLYAYVNTISLNIADIAFGWADANDVTKSWIEVYPSGFNKIIYQVNQPIDALNGITSILSYTFLDSLNTGITGVDVTGVVDHVAGTITATVPHTSTVTALVASFVLSTGASAKIGATAQVTAVTANDFSTAKAYVVTGSNFLTKTYTVTVVVAP